MNYINNKTSETSKERKVFNLTLSLAIIVENKTDKFIIK